MWRAGWAPGHLLSSTLAASAPTRVQRFKTCGGQQLTARPLAWIQDATTKNLDAAHRLHHDFEEKGPRILRPPPVEMCMWENQSRTSKDTSWPRIQTPVRARLYVSMEKKVQILA